MERGSTAAVSVRLGQYSPAGITGLDTGLAHVKRDGFAHCEVEVVVKVVGGGVELQHDTPFSTRSHRNGMEGVH
eukprot:COSAG02_NODE_13632_length_1369_cov_1.637795_4_plen_74_part_00